jgi:hypothetical protein
MTVCEAEERQHDDSRTKSVRTGKAKSQSCGPVGAERAELLFMETERLMAQGLCSAWIVYQLMARFDVLFSIFKEKASAWIRGSTICSLCVPAYGKNTRRSLSPSWALSANHHPGHSPWPI